MMRLPGQDEWRLVYGAAVLLVVGLFLYQVQAVLSPIVLFLLFLLLAVPYAGTRLHRLAVVGMSVLAALWLLRTTGFLLAPFILALVLAYILDPAVDALERRRVPRTLAVLLLALPAVGALVLAAVFGVPALGRQVDALITQAPVLLDRLARWVEALLDRLIRVDIPGLREDVLLAHVRAFEPEQLVAALQERQAEIARRAGAAVLGVGRGIGTALTIIGYVVLTPVLAFYLLKDYDKIIARLRLLIPLSRREEWLAFLAEYDTLLSRFMRGQVAAAAIVGVLTWLGLFALGFPYAGLVGVVAGVFNLVPYLGLIVSLVPAVIIALLTGNVLASLLKVAVVFGVVQFLDSSVTGPRIVGGSVGLHPVWVMLAIAMGGFFFGFVGLLIAIPAALLVKLLLRSALEKYQRSAWYTGAPPVAAE
ncbi:MAG: AI-2E family transporter [bacterium]|jgi:predicted PurR-regulated permease PerM|nr:MAG: hypothetical protein DIU52_12805 [bacterium]